MPAADQHSEVTFADYDKLKLIRRLTDRGLAQTYLAQSEDTELKIVKMGITEDIRKILKKVSQIDDPRFPKILAEQLEQGSETFCLALTFIKGKTLKEAYTITSDWVIEESLRPSFKEAKQLALNLLELQVLLVKNGILYRDVQPGNIVILPSKELALIDFEQCELSEELPHEWRSERVEGAWETAPPEELAGPSVQQEHAAVYRVGALLLLLLTGTMPFKIPSDIQMEVEPRRAATLSRKRSLECLESLPSQLKAVLRQLLHPDPKKRTATLMEAWKLIEDLEEGV